MIVNAAGQRLQYFTLTKSKTDLCPHQNTSRDIDLAESGLAIGGILQLLTLRRRVLWLSIWVFYFE
jgi:hypothetical protein